LAEMSSKLSPLRKAAILLQSLDDSTADGLLRRMPPEERERVERELTAVGEIDSEIRQRVVEEFRRLGGSPRDLAVSGIELDDSLAKKISVQTSATESTYGEASDAPPFRFLREAEADTLLKFLQHERPQVIALVMSHLAPDQAAQLLERVETDLQGQVLHCLSQLDETDPAILRDLEEHLHSQLQNHIRLRKCQAAGTAAVRAILAIVDPRKRSILVQKLAERDQAVADRLHPTRRTINSGKAEFGDSTNSADGSSIDASCFDRLPYLSNDELRLLVSRAPTETVVVALAGADARLVERVLKCVPPKQSRLLSRALKHLGPTRLGDVEEAQFELGRLAFEMDTPAANRNQARVRRAPMAQRR
jgi:flagellar motor switch protein FliG